MIDFSQVKTWHIPEGEVIKVTDAAGNVLWQKASAAVILQVAKITSDTYAAETTYEGEEFILLDIYPKSGGTVTVTYGGLAKTITDDGTAETPNAQQVYFGTFNGVSDSVETPASGELTIEGDYAAFGVGAFYKDSKFNYYYNKILRVRDWGTLTTIPSFAFYSCSSLTSVEIPGSVTSIGSNAFNNCYGLTSVEIASGVIDIGDMAFNGCDRITSVTISETVVSISSSAFRACNALAKIVVDNSNPVFMGENGILFSKDKTVLYSYPSVSDEYTIPSSVTRICDYAFYETANTGAVITVPDSVTSIGKSAFYKSGNGEYQLTANMLAITPPSVGDSAFNPKKTSTNKYCNSIIVPSGCGDAYKAADGWSSYADIIVEAS